MADTLVKFKTGDIGTLMTTKVVDDKTYPAVPLDSGTVYFAVNENDTTGKIIYDYPLVKQNLAEWNQNTAYAKDAEVSYRGKSYKSFVNNNVGHAPYGESTSYNYWREIAMRVVVGEESRWNIYPDDEDHVLYINSSLANGDEVSY